MPNGQQKLVMVPGTGVVALPDFLPDEHVAAAIRASRSQKAADQSAPPSVQSLMAEAMRRRPAQPSLSDVRKDIAARGPSVVP